MFVIVQHEVQDPATFWCILSDELQHLPEGLSLLQSLPNQFGTTEFSLWQTDQVETLQHFVEGTVGDVSHSCYFPIHAGNAYGLPAVH